MRPLALTLAAALGLGALAASPARADLTEFDTCTQIVDYAQASLDDGSYPEYVASFDGWLDARTPYDDPSLKVVDDSTTQGGYDEADDVVVSDDVTTAAAPAAGKGADDASGTNNQEADVDEPDVVKNDGQRLFLFAGDTLRVYNGREDVPTLLGERELDIADATLLRSGDKLLAIGQKPQPRRKSDEPRPTSDGTARWAQYDPQAVRVIEIDISEPSQPRVLRTMDSPGRLITARQVGSTIRLVVDSEPDFDLYDYYEMDDDEQDEFEDDLDLGDLVPTTRLKSAITGSVYKRPMAGCDDISHPSAASAGVELLLVFTVDMDKGLVGIDRQGVLASPQVVYASAGTLYVGSARSTGWYYDDYTDYEECMDSEDDEEFCRDYEYAPPGLPPDTYTDIYAFDTTTPGQTTYAGSGRVRGLPINQYAFSEYQGDLRIATTTDPWWFTEDDDDGSRADNRVTVLRKNAGGGLGQVGLLTGIGKGEEIDAVRFFGEKGYIATSRETAPLFTLDLSDPAAPKLLGELRLSSDSAYLHPLGDDLLLGIGQERGGRGDDYYKGAQVSLYDVSDPAHPRRLAQKILGQGSASTGYDPHAFLWWPRKKMALVPFWGWGSYFYDSGDGEKPDPAALVALRATAGDGPNLTELGRILHGPAWDHPAPDRAVIMGDRLFSISDLGIGSSRVSDLRPLGYVPFLYGWAVTGWPTPVPPTTPVATTPGPTSPTTPTTPVTSPGPSTPTIP